MSLLQKFDGIKDAARAVGVNSTSIIGALRGKQITSAGYKTEMYVLHGIICNEPSIKKRFYKPTLPVSFSGKPTLVS